MGYKVPFIDYPLAYHSIKNEIDDAFFGCLNSGDLIYRSDMVKFENDFSSFQDCKHGIGTGSCTNAMFISLKAAGIKPGDEIITVSHTYVASIDVIVHCGAKPVLVDVGPDHNMDTSLIEGAITEKTKGILPVHLNGRMCDMDVIEKYVDEYNLVLIEDAAQACGAKFRKKASGSFGLSGCHSFYPAKILGWYGEGGMATTNDEDFARKLYLMRDHGELPGYMKTSAEKKEAKIHLFGYNSILDNIAAAILNVKMRYLPDWINRRREIAQIYTEELSTLNHLDLMPGPGTGKYYDVYQNYVFLSEKRNKLVKHLEKNGVETLSKWKIPNHKQKALNLDHYKLPMTEKISDEVINLPMFPELTDDQILYVTRTVKDFYNNL